MMTFSVFPSPRSVLCSPRSMTIGNLQSGNRDSFRDIEIYARLKMDELGLHDWKFGWDRARRRLGVCRLLEKASPSPSTLSAPIWKPPMKSVTPSCMR